LDGDTATSTVGPSRALFEPLPQSMPVAAGDSAAMGLTTGPAKIVPNIKIEGWPWTGS
jgi:hypothetical protein